MNKLALSFGLVLPVLGSLVAVPRVLADQPACIAAAITAGNNQSGSRIAKLGACQAECLTGCSSSDQQACLDACDAAWGSSSGGGGFCIECDETVPVD